MAHIGFGSVATKRLGGYNKPKDASKLHCSNSDEITVATTVCFNAKIRCCVLITDVLLSVEVGNVGHRPVAVGMERRKSAAIVAVEEGGVAAIDGGRGGGQRRRVTGRLLHAVSPDLGSARHRRHDGWRRSFDGVLTCAVVEAEEAASFDGLGKNRQSDDAVGKEVADAPTVVSAWIKAIAFGHKNRVMMMVLSGLEMVVDRRRVR
ncbi:hypothetical protein ACLOJK_010112 [Asimina triloba]